MRPSNLTVHMFGKTTEAWEAAVVRGMSGSEYLQPSSLPVGVMVTIVEISTDHSTEDRSNCLIIC